MYGSYHGLTSIDIHYMTFQIRIPEPVDGFSPSSMMQCCHWSAQTGLKYNRMKVKQAYVQLRKPAKVNDRMTAGVLEKEVSE